MEKTLDQICIDTLRFLAVDAVQRADSGHPGLPLDAAPMAWILWSRFLKHSPQHPDWHDRDRFILSAGHGSALLYSLLFLCGYDVTIDDLKQFRQWHSRTPGHPERGHTSGVEATTGPLGQGFANAVGMAIAEAHLAATYNRPGCEIIDHRTFVLASDGDLMEGVASEAASLAGHLRLGKLVCLYDDNRVSLAAATDITFSEDRCARFAAYGWHAEQVEDGNDLDAIDAAIRRAITAGDRPSFIAVRTHIGFGSPKQDSFKAHGSPLGASDVAATKRTLGWPEQPEFLVPDEARVAGNAVRARGLEAEKAWSARWSEYATAYPELAAELSGRLDGHLPARWEEDIPVFATDAKGIASRAAGGKVLSAIAPRLPALCGGSADLDPSTNTAVKGLGVFQAADQQDEQSAEDEVWSYAGRNLHFGVREHAMGAVANGLACHGGFIPYTATFLTFSDYMRPPMRLAALSGLQAIFVFTHDSIGLGEDGPTHQPVEQLAALRAIPNMQLLRPADANETAEAWRVAIETRRTPTVLVFSRQKLPTLDRSELAPAAGVRRGAYVLLDAEKRIDLLLIATGSEVALAVEAARTLRRDGVGVRVVSMPSWELFEQQPCSYRDEVLPPTVTARLAIEAGASLGWDRYVGPQGKILGVDRFGASAPGDVVLQHYGFNVDNVTSQARSLLSPPSA
jgi:transketolase